MVNIVEVSFSVVFTVVGSWTVLEDVPDLVEVVDSSSGTGLVVETVAVLEAVGFVGSESGCFVVDPSSGTALELEAVVVEAGTGLAVLTGFVDPWTGGEADVVGFVLGESVDNTGGACGKRVDKTGGAEGKSDTSEPGDSGVKSSDVGGRVGVPDGVV